MSHTLDDEDDTPRDVLARQRVLSRMMKQGRSWSGRERNSCFLNTASGRFATVSALSGLDFPDDGRGVALVDWDHDGDLDLWISNRNAPRLRFMRNRSAPHGRFVALRPIGDGRTVCRDAIGARVEIVAATTGGSTRLMRTLRAGEGFVAQSSKWLHFGLGEATGIESVSVRWPGGTIERFDGVGIDGHFLLARGSGRATRWRRPSAPALDADRGEPDAPQASSAARIPLVTLLPVPALSFRRFDGSSATVPLAAGRALLINLWASWCAPCLEELAELSSRSADLRSAGIDVFALAVDGLGDGRSSPDAAARLAARLRLPFAHGLASAETVGALQHLHDNLTPMNRPLPVPTSFLVDAAGRLAVIYKGRVSVDTVLADRGHSLDPPERRLLRAAARPGTIIDHPVVAHARTAAETKTRFQFAFDMTEAGRLESAEESYREVIRLLPDFAEAHVNLGLVLARRGDPSGAAAQYRRALEIRPDLAAAHFNLGALAERTGDLERAIGHYRETLRLDPAYPGARNTLGVALAKQGRFPEAAAEFEEAIRRHPDAAEPHNHLGILLLQQRDVDGALARFETAIRLDPSLADAHNNLGIAHRRRGDLDAARAAYEEAVRLRPDFAEARNNLGAVLMRQGLLDEAARQFEGALRARPEFEAARKNLQRVRAMRQ